MSILEDILLKITSNEEYPRVIIGGKDLHVYSCTFNYISKTDCNTGYCTLLVSGYVDDVMEQLVYRYDFNTKVLEEI